MDNIVLAGMPGSGKSTIGVLLAKALGYSFLDVDLVIQEREGALLQEILDSRGTQAFLEAEERAVLSLDCRHTVIAPGGSALCREAAAEQSPEKVAKRLAYGKACSWSERVRQMEGELYARGILR